MTSIITELVERFVDNRLILINDHRLRFDRGNCSGDGAAGNHTTTTATATGGWRHTVTETSAVAQGLCRHAMVPRRETKTDREQDRPRGKLRTCATGTREHGAKDPMRRSGMHTDKTPVASDVGNVARRNRAGNKGENVCTGRNGNNDRRRWLRTDHFAPVDCAQTVAIKLEIFMSSSSGGDGKSPRNPIHKKLGCANPSMIPKVNGQLSITLRSKRSIDTQKCITPDST